MSLTAQVELNWTSSTNIWTDFDFENQSFDTRNQFWTHLELKKQYLDKFGTKRLKFGQIMTLIIKVLTLETNFGQIWN